jgi:hypothetical protein
LVLGIPAHHYVEAIVGTANIAKLGNIVEKIGTPQRICRAVRSSRRPKARRSR